MSLNNYFNWKRFTRLLKQDLLINKTKYLLGTIGLGFITYLLTYWFLSSNKIHLVHYIYSINGYYMTSFVFFMMAVGVIIGTAFPDLKDKIKTANYLLTPASTLEKYLVQFVVRIGLFIPIALGIFWIAIRLAKASLTKDYDKYFDPELVPYFEFQLFVTGYEGKILDTSVILSMIFGLFSYGAFLFAGSTFFKRFALIKTVVFAGILFCTGILFSMCLSYILNDQANFFTIELVAFQISQNLHSSVVFLRVLSMLSWIFFLRFAYFKLKEKEV